MNEQQIKEIMALVDAYAKVLVQGAACHAAGFDVREEVAEAKASREAIESALRAAVPDERNRLALKLCANTSTESLWILVEDNDLDLEKISARFEALRAAVPEGQVLLDRKLAENCLAGMKYAAHWERDRDGRPPSQVCCFEIRDLEAALEALHQRAPVHGRPMSERAAEVNADPVRGPRIAALREKLAKQAPQAAQPVQPSDPLSIAEVEAILARWNYELHGDRARFIVRETERAHGIAAIQAEVKS